MAISQILVQGETHDINAITAITAGVANNVMLAEAESGQTIYFTGTTEIDTDRSNMRYNPNIYIDAANGNLTCLSIIASGDMSLTGDMSITGTASITGDVSIANIPASMLPTGGKSSYNLNIGPTTLRYYKPGGSVLPGTFIFNGLSCSSPLSVNGIVQCDEPLADNHATTKNYVDTVASTLSSVTIREW